MGHTHRVSQTRAAIADAGADAMLVTKPVNVRWLCGFTGSNSQLVISQDAIVLITDGRYREQADAEIAAAGIDAEVKITRSEDIAMIGLAAADSAERTCHLAVESSHVTKQRWDQLETGLDETVLVPVTDVIESLRRVKDPGEIDRLKRAAAIADAALEAVVPMLSQKPYEAQVAAELDYNIRLFGGSRSGFETIVASGPNSALPHARPGSRRIEAGDLVVIDMGAVVDGYTSDMTRTFSIGEPTRQHQRLWDAVMASQLAGLSEVRCGVQEQAVDAACRSVLDRHGLAEAFVHGTGHAIGLEIHEQPILSSRSEGILVADQVVTVEPGVYLPGLGGVRIEDSVVVTTGGCEPITLHPKNFAI